MATVVKKLLSASTNGRTISIAATATLGTTVHTSISSAASWDEIWLWANNTSSSNQNLSIEWGAAGVNNTKVYQLPPAPAGDILVVPGQVLNNSLVLTAFSTAASTVMVSGFVNNIV